MYTEMPPGVPVSMNAAGDWCRRIIKIAKAVLPAIGQIPGVIGNVAKVASPIVSLIDNKMAHKKGQGSTQNNRDSAGRRLGVKSIS